MTTKNNKEKQIIYGHINRLPQYKDKLAFPEAYINAYLLTHIDRMYVTSHYKLSLTGHTLDVDSILYGEYLKDFSKEKANQRSNPIQNRVTENEKFTQSDFSVILSVTISEIVYQVKHYRNEGGTTQNKQQLQLFLSKFIAETYNPTKLSVKPAILYDAFMRFNINTNYEAKISTMEFKSLLSLCGIRLQTLYIGDKSDGVRAPRYKIDSNPTLINNFKDEYSIEITYEEYGY